MTYKEKIIREYLINIVDEDLDKLSYNQLSDYCNYYLGISDGSFSASDLSYLLAIFVDRIIDERFHTISDGTKDDYDIAYNHKYYKVEVDRLYMV